MEIGALDDWGGGCVAFGRLRFLSGLSECDREEFGGVDLGGL